MAMVSIRAAAVALLLAVTASPVMAAEGVRLTPQPPIAADNAAFPRIAAPLTPATTKINTALARLDRTWRGFIKDCRSEGRNTMTSRKVAVAMAGPEFLSLVESDETDCGGAHPNEGTMALVYDLATGRPVNWEALMPGGLVDSATLDSTTDGTSIGVVESARLSALYKPAALALMDAELRNDCAGFFETASPQLMIWADARQGALVFKPDFPHVAAACGLPVPIPTATLRRLGVNTRLLDAIDAAHAAER